MIHLLPKRIDREHPLIRKEYAVYTPPIDEMIETIGDWVDRRIPGGYVHGPSRFGKSRGVKFHVRSELAKRFKATIPLVVWIRPSEFQRSEGRFWHEILHASEFAFLRPEKPKPAAEGSYLVQERFITIAREARTNYVVLLIDEAQEVTYNEWKWLTGLQNKLDWVGFRLSVFSVGTQQIAYKHALLGKSGNAHVAARFMVESARFHGIRSEAELNYVLNGYDCDSEWPKGSKMSFHRYFSPSGFDRGERLADTASAMWNALGELGPKSDEFPMQHVAFAVEMTLYKLACNEEWCSLTSPEGWKTSLGQTSLRKHMELVSTAG